MIASADRGRACLTTNRLFGEPAADWYATEQDKVALFTRRFGVPVHHLPQRVYLARHHRRAGSTTRHFIHKLPISLTGEAPVITAADPVITAADTMITAADPVITAADPVITAADTMITAADPVITAADRHFASGLEKLSRVLRFSSSVQQPTGGVEACP